MAIPTDDKLKVLVVDDDELNQRMMRLILSREDHQVKIASNTVFRRPLAMEVNMPEPGAKVEVPESNVMTIYILEDGSMFYDVGKRGLQGLEWDQLRETLVLEADYNPELIVLVKVDREARYIKMMDMLDTMDEAQMTRFSIIPMNEIDKAMIEGGGL